MGRYRGKLEIVADILSVVRGGAKKTEIMYQANLSYSLLVRYLRDVMEADLVARGNDNSYMLTEKGLEFLNRFNSYHERNQELERQQNSINDEKMMLETKFLNADFWNSPSKSGVAKKKR